jgi:hypothetical protein
VAVLGLLRVLTRIPEDRAAGWTVPYIAAGGSRRALAFLLCGAVVAAMYAALLSWGTAYGLAHLSAGGGPAPLLDLPRILVKSVPLLLAMCALGMLISLLARSTLSAISILIASVAAPTLLVITYASRHEQWPENLVRWAFLHLPPMPADTAGRMLLEYGLYVGVVGALAAVLAHWRIGRCT